MKLQKKDYNEPIFSKQKDQHSILALVQSKDQKDNPSIGLKPRMYSHYNDENDSKNGKRPKLSETKKGTTIF